MNKDKAVLWEKLNQALNELNFFYPSFNSDLYNKYYGTERETAVVFTRAERDYIKSAPHVVILYDDTWYPMEYYDAKEKKFFGIVPEILALISEKSGLKFTPEGINAPAPALSGKMKSEKTSSAL